MRARYRFRVRFHLDPEGVSVDPAAFETSLRYPAPHPGEEGWRFFRDALWRGECADPADVRARASEALGVAVDDVSFRAFETDPDYYEALQAAIADDLEEFRASTVEAVLNKYLGSRVEVRRDWISG